jgi:hypothetical protein
MGSEDLFHRRKARAGAELQRQKRERGKKSVGDQVVSVLKTKPGFAKYGKGQKGIYGQLKDKLADAITHAERLRKRGAATGSINPATDVDGLVKAIQALAGK